MKNLSQQQRAAHYALGVQWLCVIIKHPLKLSPVSKVILIWEEETLLSLHLIFKSYFLSLFGRLDFYFLLTKNSSPANILSILATELGVK